MKAVFHALGAILLGLAAALVVPVPVSLLAGGEGAGDFLLSAWATALAGGALFFACRGVRELTLRGSFLLVSLAWTACGLFGALPFWLSGAYSSYADAFFETVSGFTTTGATVLSAAGVDALPVGFHFWRAFIQWLGGMGIIVLSVAVLPALQAGGFKVFQAEVPGHVKERLMPRIRETAKILWGVYLVVTVAQILLLWGCGMPLYDSLIHSFTTLATGGFSNRGASVGAYGELRFELIIVFFMFLAGANFVLHYRAFAGRRLWGYWRDEEFRFYALVVVGATLALAVSLWAAGVLGPAESFRQALFQAVSIVTTTGYATADFGAWPAFCQLVLLGLMFLGGCGGSTGGAMKQVRVLLLFRSARAQLRMSLHPQAVIPIHLNRQEVVPPVLGRIHAFFFLYLGVVVGLSALCASFGLDMMTSISAVAATVGNVGPGLAKVGPAFDYGTLPAVLKWALSGGMIVGRLEVFTVLVLFQPRFWRSWG